MIGSGVPAGAEKPFQDAELETRQRLGHRRNVRRRRNPLRGADRDQPDLVAVDVRQQRRGVAEIKIDLPGHQIGHRLRLALGRDHDEVDAGAREQQHRREMADVLRAGDREVQLAGIGFGVGDELRQRLDRQLALDRRSSACRCPCW